MGKADRHIKRQQEIQQRSQLFKPYKSLNSFASYQDVGLERNSQLKLANDLVSKKKRR